MRVLAIPMEDYLPFFVKNWRTIAVMAGSLAAGVAVERYYKAPSPAAVGTVTVTTRQVQRRKETADDSDNEENDDEVDAHGAEALPRVLYQYARPSSADSIQRSAEFYQRMNQRRSVRQISSDAVPLQVIQNIIKAGGNTKFMFELSSF